jgi:D-alanyl-D-alanine carboxypeptidase
MRILDQLPRDLWLRRVSISAIAFTLFSTAGPIESASARERAAYVVDAVTNEVLHASNADAQIHPASLTKMMTLYLLFDALSRGEMRLSTQMPVSRRAAGREPSKLGLPAGSIISVQDAIGGLIIKSANDVATVVAEALGGSETNFAQMMTNKARLLGMSQTTFQNASGLHHTRQVSTARDMARLGRALFEHFPQYYGLFSIDEFEYGGRTYTTHNDLVTDYAGADGIKTGYVRASGFNVVTSARRNGRRLIGVVIGGDNARSRDRQMHRLLDAAFSLANSRASNGTAQSRALLLTDLPGASRSNQIEVSTLMRPSPRPGSSRPRSAPEVRPVSQDLMLLASMVARRPGQSNNPAPSAPSAAPSADDQRRDLIAAIFPADRRPENLASRPPPTQISRNSGPPTPVSGTRLALSTMSDSEWGIQVGAFGTAASAEIFATRVADQLPIDTQTLARVQPIDVNGRDLFRARLFGFSQQEAMASCGHLMANGQSCMLVTPNGTNRNPN